jgi:glycosyltransferase involved in cell wall biosynthesis
MKILVVHNSYQQQGGEYAARETEIGLLLQAGHHVVEFQRFNNEISGYSNLQKIRLGWQTTWSQQTLHEMRAVLRKESPEVVHFHNTLPLISPSAYYACAEEGVPVVQTLHNYRLLCPAATFLRDGQVCEECIGRSVPWRAVAHACYRESRASSAAVATMLVVHRALQTWQKKIDVYIALTEFARQKHIQGGLPAERIVVKPNSVYSDPGAKCGPGEYAIYIGRLSEEKGLRLLLEAWTVLAAPIPLLIVGDGPLRNHLAAEIAKRGLMHISLTGHLANHKTLGLLQRARFLVLPSICYEGFPVTVAESYASGIPVIASRHGALEEIVADGQTGMLFEPNNPRDLAEKALLAWRQGRTMQAMGRAARNEYERKYQPSVNYESLMRIYRHAASMAEPPPLAMLASP